uniref:ATP synthase F0 subunit 8 n=1 Tax=Haemaphysalis colasbelcouri TaxID=2926932 RepID=A0A976MY54_9ACAR|nr:ATP synthase F0 subunit 8 [Haemaphysalis colasbelcouri]UNO54004.1 ATP synthase F0 subunit 8 [Haemaphysalis colasbelcouri]
MPQLFPMNWILISTIMTIIFMMTMMMIYFFKLKMNFLINENKQFLKKNKMTFKW